MRVFYLLLLMSIGILGKAQVTTKFQILNGQKVIEETFLTINQPEYSTVSLRGSNPYMSFYKDGTFVGYVQNINNTLEIGSKNGFPVTFWGGGTTLFEIDGLTGTSRIWNRGFQISNTVNIAGPLQLGSSANPGLAGQALRSGGIAKSPYWSKFSANPTIGFRAKKNTNLSVASNGITNIGALSVVFDDFDAPATFGVNASGDYVASSTGLYHFDISIPYFEWSGNSNGNIYIELLKNNLVVQSYNQQYGSFGSSVISDAINCSFDVKAALNDVFKFRLSQINSLANNIFIPNAAISNDQRIVISGFKVY